MRMLHTIPTAGCVQGDPYGCGKAVTIYDTEFDGADSITRNKAPGGHCRSTAALSSRESMEPTPSGT